MKIHVTQLVRDRDSEEIVFIEKPRDIYVDDISCLYKDRYGNYIYLKNSKCVRITHDISEIEIYLGSRIL